MSVRSNTHTCGRWEVSGQPALTNKLASRFWLGIGDALQFAPFDGDCVTDLLPIITRVHNQK